MNKRKVFFRNRVKCFYTQPKGPGENRLKGGERNFISGSNKEREEMERENPEEESDFS